MAVAPASPDGLRIAGDAGMDDIVAIRFKHQRPVVFGGPFCVCVPRAVRLGRTVTPKKAKRPISAIIGRRDSETCLQASPLPSPPAAMRHPSARTDQIASRLSPIAS